MNEKTGDTLWQPDGSGGVQPQRVGGGSRSSQLPEGLVLEAPANGSPHARQDGAWVPVPVDEAPEDGSLYLRGNGGWALYTPPAPGVDEAPQDGVQYTRQDGQWVNVNPIQSGLVVQGPTTIQGDFNVDVGGAAHPLRFQNQSPYTAAYGRVGFQDRVYFENHLYSSWEPTSGGGVGNRDYNDYRYAASTETWYRLSNSFSAGNAVQVWLSSGVKDDYGARLFTRSGDRLNPNRSGTWMYAVTAAFENLQSATTRSNRMLSIRKNGATVFRNNVNDNESSAMMVHCTVVLGSTDYLSVEMRVGHATTADVFLQATNIGPVG